MIIMEHDLIPIYCDIYSVCKQMLKIDVTMWLENIINYS